MWPFKKKEQPPLPEIKREPIQIARVHLNNKQFSCEYISAADVDRLKSTVRGLVTDVQTYDRVYGSEPGPGGRWTDWKTFYGYVKGSVYSINIEHVTAVDQPWDTKEIVNLDDVKVDRELRVH